MMIMVQVKVHEGVPQCPGLLLLSTAWFEIIQYIDSTHAFFQPECQESLLHRSINTCYYMYLWDFG